jgi:hypothetical protein
MATADTLYIQMLEQQQQAGQTSDTCTISTSICDLSTTRVMPVQSELFPEIVTEGRLIRHRSRSEVTFQGGTDQPAHRWFRLTASFWPDLVGSFLEEFAADSSSIVLDPFAGRGTTIIECKRRGIATVGVEINPFLHFAAETSLNWSLSINECKSCLAGILDTTELLLSRYPQSSAIKFAEFIGIEYPQIHNIDRWWHNDVLKALIAIRFSILKVCKSESLRNFFLLSIANILVDAANVTIGRLQLHFVDRNVTAIRPIQLFIESCIKAIDDLSTLGSLHDGTSARVMHGDSTKLTQLFLKQSFTHVITSPPYPNRYSYVGNTRPHLYFLNLFTSAKEAGNLDCATIAGTWGAPTSRHVKGIHPFRHKASADACGSIVEEIRRKDLLMSNYVARYFDDLANHIMSMRPVLAERAICAYVVENSRMKGSLVKTDDILAAIFTNLGYTVLGIVELRKRNSGAALRETAVVVQR